LLGTKLIEPSEDPKTRKPVAGTKYRTTFYDYTNNRSIIVSGDLRRPQSAEVEESASQPLPSAEEFEEAAQIAMGHSELASLVQQYELRPYPPMPPLLLDELPDGRIERTINVGLIPRTGMKGHEIVAVNMIRNTVTRFAPSERGRAPLTSAAHNPICGQAYSAQATTNSGGGSAWVTVKQGGATVWKFLLVRPSGSSGTNGSGVELRFVDTRGSACSTGHTFQF